MSVPTLPPGIEGLAQGVLKLSLTDISWSIQPIEALFRVRFWGEEASGFLIESSTTFLSYEIRTSLQLLLKYLLDMENLIIDVIDLQGALIGQIKVNLQPLSKNKKAINFRGKFPIVLTNKKVAGMASVVIRSNFQRPESEVLASFKKNEIIAANEDKQPTQSKAADTPTATKTILIPRSSLNKIPKPLAPLKSALRTEVSPIKSLVVEPPSEPLGHILPESNEDQQLDESLLNGKVKLNISEFKHHSPTKPSLVSIECLLYHPIDPSQPMLPDSFTISSISNSNNTYNFSSKTSHSLLVPSASSLSILNYKLVFSLIAEFNNQALPLGTCEIMWKDIIFNSGFKTIYNLEVTNQDATLGELQIETTLKRPASSLPEQDLLNIFYICIEEGYRFETAPNLFFSYKSLFDMKTINTPVIWNYEGQNIGHEMMMPCDEIMVRRLKETCLMIEVWDKQEKDVLIGIAKASLGGIGVPFAGSVYPSVVVDGFVPVVNPSKATEVGYVKLCVAVGTSVQIQKISRRCEAFKKTAGSQGFRNSRFDNVEASKTAKNTEFIDVTFQGK